MNVFLVRHTAYSNPENIFPFRLPLELSQEGIDHSRRIGEWFKKKNFFNMPIYSSPVKRSMQTAEIIAEAIGSKVVEDERLTESYCPDLEGKKAPEDEQETWKAQCGNSSRETSELIQKRTLECFQENVERGKDCILVSHGDPLTALLYFLINRPLTPCLFDDEHFDVYVKRGEIIQIKIRSGYQIERFII